MHKFSRQLLLIASTTSNMKKTLCGFNFLPKPVILTLAQELQHYDPLHGMLTFYHLHPLFHK